MTFGGLGNNPFNPALVGSVFLLISFPVQMTSWPVPTGFNTGYTDAVTGATPLAIIKRGNQKWRTDVSALWRRSPRNANVSWENGRINGRSCSHCSHSGRFIYLLWKKIITWHIPVSIIGTVAIFTAILMASQPG